MAVIDVKCECGHSFKTEFDKDDEILFCEACGSLVINDLASEIEDKIEQSLDRLFDEDKKKAKKLG